MSIEKLTFLGVDAVRLCFDRYEATILYGRGCNVIDFKVITPKEVLSILHTPTQEDMAEFEKSPQRFGSAVLFPPNKIAGGIYDWEGRTYDLNSNGIHFSHGVLKEAAYELVHMSQTPQSVCVKCALHSSATPYFKAFNWDFKVTFEFELSREGLSQNLIIDNTGRENIPFGAGYHTAFLFPQNKNYTACDYCIEVSSDYQWETDENLIPTGRLIKQHIPYSKGGVAPLAGKLNDHLRAALSENGFNRAVITNKKNGQQFIYETAPDFGNWMIWNNNADFDYVCIEPMTCIIDAPHSTLSPHEHGFMTLKAGERWSAKVLLHMA
jgi:aldose 1-epimerase